MNGTKGEKHATALALFPADSTDSLKVGLFLQNDEYRTGVTERKVCVYRIHIVTCGKREGQSR